MKPSLSPGAKFRAAVDAENPLQVVGCVNAYAARTDKHIDDVKVAAHPAEILLDKAGRTVFVAVSPSNQIQVIDAEKREVVSTFPVSSQRPGDAAFDESTHRLFLGTRTPPTMTVLDSTSGKELASLPTVQGMDGVYFDAAHKRVYVSGGRGFDVAFVFAYQQKGPDHYEFIGKVSTRPGAGTSFWAPGCAPPTSAEAPPRRNSGKPSPTHCTWKKPDQFDFFRRTALIRKLSPREPIPRRGDRRFRPRWKNSLFDYCRTQTSGAPVKRKP